MTKVTFALLGLLLIACAPGVTGGQAPLPTATVRIVSPVDGTPLQGDTVSVSIDVQNFTLVPLGSAKKSGEGHIHFTLDGRLQMTDKPTFAYTAVSPGSHVLEVELVDSNHASLSPKVSQQLNVVTVLAAGATPAATPASSTDAGY